MLSLRAPQSQWRQLTCRREAGQTNSMPTPPDTLPSLSVVLPNFNHAQHLPASLAAILSQSLPALEIIVIDDCSTDNSVEVIQSFAAKHSTIRFIRNEVNQGVVWNMNHGLKLARGDYVVFPAADDQVRHLASLPVA